MLTMNEPALRLVQQYLQPAPLPYDDPLFSQLYHDLNDFVRQNTGKVFEHRRPVAIYGERGIGKSTAMHGVLVAGLARHLVERPLPVVVEVTGASAAENLDALQQFFYRAIISGIARVGLQRNRLELAKKIAERYGPRVGRKITEAAALIFPPVALAAEGVEQVLKGVLGRLHVKELDILLSSREANLQQIADSTLRELERDNYVPILIVDELDKVRDDVLLSDFFDGNQAFFQGRRLIQSLSYTFGESTREALMSSVRRFSEVELFRGISSLKDVEAIVLSRVRLGLAQAGTTNPDEEARTLFPNDTLKALANVSAPNTNMLLNRAYSAVEQAIALRSEIIRPEFLQHDLGPIPSELETLILRQLSKSKAGPTEVASRLHKTKQSVSRALLKMTGQGWVSRTGEGKRSYYAITERGYLALRLASRK